VNIHSQRPLRKNTQHSQATDNHVHCGNRTRILSKQAAADPRLKLCGRRDGPFMDVIYVKKLECTVILTTSIKEIE